MTKEEAIAKAKLIGLRALEDIVKEVAIPMLGAFVAKKNTTAKLIYAALKGPLDEIADKIDGEVG